VQVVRHPPEKSAKRICRHGRYRTDTDDPVSDDFIRRSGPAPRCNFTALQDLFEGDNGVKR
jgi:hypothetical protein